MQFCVLVTLVTVILCWVLFTGKWTFQLQVSKQPSHERPNLSDQVVLIKPYRKVLGSFGLIGEIE